MTASKPVLEIFPASDLIDSLKSLVIRFLNTAFPSFELVEKPNLETCPELFPSTLKTRSLFVNARPLA